MANWINERINFYYDPAREGYDTTLWKTVSGVPTVASNKIRLNAAKIINYADMFKVEVTYKMIIPTVPSAYLTGGNAATANPATWALVTDGQFRITINGLTIDFLALDFTGVASMAEVAAVIQVALRAAAGGVLHTVEWSTNHFVITATKDTVSTISVTSSVGGAGTDISGAGGTTYLDMEVGVGTVTNSSAREFGLQQMGCTAGLTFKILNGALTAECLYEGISSSTVIPWLPAWTNTDTYFTIKWTGFSAEFLIGGLRYAFITDTSVPKKALSMTFTNTTADNMDIVCIDANNIQGYI